MMWITSLRGGVGCEAFLDFPAHIRTARAAAPCSVTLEQHVGIHHRVIDTLNTISTPPTGNIDLLFDGTLDSRGVIRSLKKLTSCIIELADTINQ
jgi:hypothetical protein